MSAALHRRLLLLETAGQVDNVPRLVLVWSAFIGGVACSFERSHLMAGLLPFVVRNPRVLNVFERVNQTLIIVGLAALGYAGWQLADLTRDQTLPALDVSAGTVYLALPFACAITIVVHLAQLFSAAPAAAKE